MRNRRGPMLYLLLATAVSASRATSQAPASMSPSPVLACNSDSVQISTEGHVLLGSVRCPSSPAPWPVVLLISGSGPTDRDGNSAMLPGPNNSLRMLAEALAARGIASARYDKRGIGASRLAMGSEDDVRFDMYADDASTWAQQLRADSRFTTVTVVGHSEGSLLGMLATRHANADGFVSIAGAGRPAGQILHDQLLAQAPAALVAEADRAIARLVEGRKTDSVSPALASLFRPSVQPYLISWFRHNPAVELQALKVPVLIIQGTTDIQVAVQDARLLAAAQSKATLLIVDGMNHVLKLVPAEQSAQVRSYSDPALPVAPTLIDAIATFVKDLRRH